MESRTENRILAVPDSDSYVHPTELCCTLLSYAAPYWATLAPYWAVLHFSELRCTVLSCVAPCCWGTVHPSLCCAPLSCSSYSVLRGMPLLRYTLLSSAAPFWGASHPLWPSALRCIPYVFLLNTELLDGSVLVLYLTGNANAGTVKIRGPTKLRYRTQMTGYRNAYVGYFGPSAQLCFLHFSFFLVYKTR